jgi:hypothetical protein
VIQPVLPLHECANPATAVPLHSVADSGPAEPLKSIANSFADFAVAGAAMIETS